MAERPRRETGDLTCSEAGRLGGLVTLARYGREHYRRAGHKGQAVFRRPEQILKRVLEEALRPHGFQVKRTGIGSDFVLDEDFITDDQEQGLEVTSKTPPRSWLVEVKSTHYGFTVSLTLTQARQALSPDSSFVLCICDLRPVTVNITEELARQQTTFVFLDDAEKGRLEAVIEKREELQATASPDSMFSFDAQNERIRVAWEAAEDQLPLDDAVSRFISA